MNYEHLLEIDRAGGKLAHSSFTKLRRITTRILRKHQMAAAGRLPADVKRMLVVKLWGLGNHVLAGRALKSLRVGYPQAQITLLTTPANAPLYEGNNLYDKTVTLDVSDPKDLKPEVERIAGFLSGQQYQVAVSLDGLSELSAALARMSRADVTVGMAGGERTGGFGIEHTYNPDKRAEDLMYEVALAAGGEAVPDELVRPALRAHDRATVQEILSAHEVDSHTLLVGFIPAPGHFAERRGWPMEKFALLAQKIEEQAEFRTVFFGAREDERQVMRAVKLMGSPGINTSGLLSVRQLAAFLEETHLVIGNDSGPMHLAAALGVPTVSIFGPESPARVARQDHEQHASIYHPRECSPCVSLLGMTKGECTCGAKCITEIPVEEVRAVVMDLLDHLADPDEPPWMAKK